MEMFLPKFKLTQQFSLNDVCQKWEQVKCSLLARQTSVVSQQIHCMFHCMFEVNEEGTEAAAATGIGVNALSLKPMFNVDHPFLFFIRQNDTGAILFMGRLLKPSED